MKNKIFMALCLIIMVSISAVHVFGAEEEYYQANFIEGKGLYEVNGDYYNGIIFDSVFDGAVDYLDRIPKDKYHEILKNKIFLNIYKNVSGDSYTVSYQGKSIAFSTEYLTSYMDLYIKDNKILFENFKRSIINKYVGELLTLDEEIKEYINDQNLTDSSSGGPEFLKMQKICEGLWWGIDQWKEPNSLLGSEKIYYWDEPSNYDEIKEVEEQVSNVVRRVKYLGFIREIKEVFNQYVEMKTFVDNCQFVNNAGTTDNSGGSDNTSSAEPICPDGWWECAFKFMEEGQKPENNLSDVLGGVTATVEDIGDMIFDIGNMIFIIVISVLGVKYIWGGANTKFEIKNSLVTVVVAAIVFYGWNSVAGILNIEGLLTGPDGSSYHGLAYTVYNTILYIVNVLAVGGIIYIGIKYMMAGADGKAEMKVKAIPVIMGIIMVYGTLNLINFILKIAGV